MRLGLIIAGVIVAALGVVTLMGKFNYQKTDEIARVGDLKADVKRDKTVPQWAGIVAIVVGGVLLIGGASRKS
jgi:outer membrane murein-binding lipoprotein Lpp